MKKSLNIPSLILFLLCFCVSGCGVLQKKKPEEADPTLVVSKEPLEPEEAKELMKEVGEGWLYGQGMGSTMLNVGAIALFPPYALYVLGNTALSLSGYEPLYASKLLPDESEQEVNRMYNSVTAFPGRVAAAVAGEEYRSRKVIAKRMNRFQQRIKNKKNSGPNSAGSPNGDYSEVQEMEPQKDSYRLNTFAAPNGSSLSPDAGEKY